MYVVLSARTLMQSLVDGSNFQNKSNVAIDKSQITMPANHMVLEIQVQREEENLLLPTPSFHRLVERNGDARWHLKKVANVMLVRYLHHHKQHVNLRLNP